MTLLAATLASRLHAGQVDKQGAPYIDHLTAVVGILRERWPEAPPHALEAAWLHDAMEDTGASAESLRAEGVSEEAIQLVQLLTKPAGAIYQDWIAALAASGDLWAIRVKLADNAHNSMPERAIPDMVERRYGPARERLEAAERGSDGR
ncbi:HD domain-containing protein [Roseomonas populi]|uniref:HD domain-containing protein n=1 Tax=Roseomonas populi TaxID=3121582 RepID=A0ABT1XC76_9PROT|nr:HD domain-containing protein [Roseomonas pecuniae]MCR0985733.1 HD domain-containing protein [Roseomonas pecuniae]